MKKYFAFLLFAMLVWPGENSFAQASNKKLDKFFVRKMKKAHLVGLQVAYLVKGELAWVGSYGLKNSSTKEPVNDHTLFMIASCSKPVTAVALMKLYDDGRFRLDDDINNWLPFKVGNPNFPGNPITLRMLLTHTSSLKDDNDLLFTLYTMPKGGDSPIAVEEFVKDYFLPGGLYYSAGNNFSKEAPGTKKLYCNAGFALAGYLIERISGMAFSDFMKTAVFAPLSMNESGWYLRDLPDSNMAFPHKGDFTVMNHYGYPTVADGQLRTSVTEYAQIIKIMLNNGMSGDSVYLRKATIDTILAVQFTKVNKWQAIAWNYNEFDNWLYYLLMPRLASHTGVDPGVNTVTSFDPKTKTGVILFSNVLTTKLKAQRIFYQAMVKRLQKEARRSG
jgi:CubicO group peptidase (beta-lactamase class C family)